MSLCRPTSLAIFDGAALATFVLKNFIMFLQGKNISEMSFEDAIEIRVGRIFDVGLGDMDKTMFGRNIVHSNTFDI